jgi:hypothetical protein
MKPDTTEGSIPVHIQYLRGPRNNIRVPSGVHILAVALARLHDINVLNIEWNWSNLTTHLFRVFQDGLISRQFPFNRVEGGQSAGGSYFDLHRRDLQLEMRHPGGLSRMMSFRTHDIQEVIPLPAWSFVLHFFSCTRLFVMYR